MLDESGQSRSACRTRTTLSPTRRDAAPYGTVRRGRAGLPRGALTVHGLGVVMFTGTETYAEA